MQQFECVEATEDEMAAGGVLPHHIAPYNDRPCMNEKVYPIQFIAIGFAGVYLIGIPTFFYRLIRKAVKMIDAHGYKDEVWRVKSWW